MTTISFTPNEISVLLAGLVCLGNNIKHNDPKVDEKLLFLMALSDRIKRITKKSSVK
jgi:hypothetical protein